MPWSAGRMALFQSGNFTLHSGKQSDYKIDCDALYDADWQTIARMVAKLVRPFKSVEGIPRGGLRLAHYLTPLCLPDAEDHLVVDDVLTTGTSINKAMTDYLLYNPGSVVVGAVVFARGPCPPGVVAVCQLPKELW